MKNTRLIFSSQGLSKLQRIVRQKPLIAFDLDGTLVPIITDFRKVRLDGKTRNLLNRLAENFNVVIVSGRSRRDVLSRIGINGLKVIGNHGLEGLMKSAETKAIKLWERELRAALKGFSGAVIENKKYSLTVHYRTCPNKRRVRARVLEVLSKLPRTPRVILGKDVFNLMPDLGVNKGTAILDLMKKLKCKSAVFVGDDITDEDVFALGSPKLLTVKVGSPRKTYAQFFVRRQTDVYKLAERIDRISRS